MVCGVFCLLLQFHFPPFPTHPVFWEADLCGATMGSLPSDFCLGLANGDPSGRSAGVGQLSPDPLLGATAPAERPSLLLTGHHSRCFSGHVDQS